MREWTYPWRGDFLHAQLVGAGEGWVFCVAKHDGKFYAIMDEGTLSDFLRDDDDLHELIRIHEFDDERHRAEFIALTLARPQPPPFGETRDADRLPIASPPQPSDHRTIIDVLRRGNQELFHSAMIAWLLDPSGEHPHGNRVLRALLVTATKRGPEGARPRFTQALQELDRGARVNVRTEAPGRRSRYDIEIKIDSTTIILENKTKSFGSASQLATYAGDDRLVIALGLCDASFAGTVGEQYPLLTYGDLRDSLAQLGDGEGDFAVLVRHYRAYLQRELGALDLIDRCFGKCEMERHAAELRGEMLASQSGRSSNDLRFLNLYFLEKFRRQLTQDPQWTGAVWKSDKDMQSGVWLANHEGRPSSFRFSGWCEQHAENLWFHLELDERAMQSGPDEPAGRIQLRCCFKKEKQKRELVQEFRRAYPCGTDERYSAKIVSKADTFFLMVRTIKGRDLTYDRLEALLADCHRRFGSFDVAPVGASS